MHRIMATVVAVAMVMLFSGMAFAGDFGMCSYGSHVNQAKTDQVDSSKTVATKTVPGKSANQLLLAQTEKMPKPAPKTHK